MTLAGAVPNGVKWPVLGLAANPTPLLGTLVPVDIAAVVRLPTDAHCVRAEAARRCGCAVVRLCAGSAD